jgi:hypothetical protein
VAPRPPERDFAGTPYVPVYVMLPVSTHLFHFLGLDLCAIVFRSPIRSVFVAAWGGEWQR